MIEIIKILRGGYDPSVSQGLVSYKQEKRTCGHSLSLDKIKVQIGRKEIFVYLANSWQMELFT